MRKVKILLLMLGVVMYYMLDLIGNDVMAKTLLFNIDLFWYALLSGQYSIDEMLRLVMLMLPGIAVLLGIIWFFFNLLQEVAVDMIAEQLAALEK